MSNVGALYVGQVSPQAYRLIASRWGVEDTFDFTIVTSASIKVVKPSGATATWSGSISAQSTTGLTVTHPLVAGDVDEAGAYRAYLLMTVPGGGDRTETDEFFVSEEFAV